MEHARRIRARRTLSLLILCWKYGTCCGDSFPAWICSDNNCCSVIGVNSKICGCDRVQWFRILYYILQFISLAPLCTSFKAKIRIAAGTSTLFWNSTTPVLIWMALTGMQMQGWFRPTTSYHKERTFPCTCPQHLKSQAKQENNKTRNDKGAIKMTQRWQRNGKEMAKFAQRTCKEWQANQKQMRKGWQTNANTWQPNGKEMTNDIGLANTNIWQTGDTQMVNKSQRDGKEWQRNAKGLSRLTGYR